MGEQIIQFIGVIFLLLAVAESFRVQHVQGWKRFGSAAICLVIVIVGGLLITRPDIIINIADYLIAKR